MEIKRNTSLLLLFFLLSLLYHRPTSASYQSYVVFFGENSQNQDGLTSMLTQEQKEDSHYEILGSIIGSKAKARDAIFYSYTKHINGFAATLEEDEAKEISKRSDVISVIPNKLYKLHTTRSWDFLGLEKNGITPSGSLWKKARFGEDTIIGNIDSGVWPESQSFRDEGLGPIPSKWKGSCEKGIACNRKLIGAQYFNKGFIASGGQIDPGLNYSTVDTDGHGTHTLSTAGGSFVPNASLFGYSNGTAKGGSPKARVAAYKVCWGSGCTTADILAAFIAAIHDGVDVLSVSLGGEISEFIDDGSAIGSFLAVKNGITVVFSGGNGGPMPESVSNLAPWMFTVGASTLDRKYTTYLALGNKHHIEGESLSTKRLEAFKPMISATDAVASTNSTANAQLCLPRSLDPEKVKGKIVVCVRGNNARAQKSFVVLEAGGVGMVLVNDPDSGNEIIADSHILPAIHISYTDGVTLFSYLNSTKSPYGYITKPKTNIGVKPAPVMAAFSSQGPNLLNPEILKPDITAPGVSILAAFSGAQSPTELPEDNRRVPFNSESGTSMSCPHVAGIVGLLKTLYPHWTPSAIKSAIMTTAITEDNAQEPINNASFVKATAFSYGSGHVNPNSAMDPGLVYDLTIVDYLNFLCSLGYNSSQLAVFNGKPYSCPSKPLRLENLNYPSIAVPKLSGTTTILRAVKNVGTPGKYKAYVTAPEGIAVSVKPKVLNFKKVGEEEKFLVVFKAESGVSKDYAFGTLTWSDGKHVVKSPIVVKVV